MDEREKTQTITMSLFVYEQEQLRIDRRDRRQIKAIVVMAVVVAIMACAIYLVHRADVAAIERVNQTWIDYISEFDFEDYGYQQDGRGVNIIGNLNGVDYDNYGTDVESPSEDAQGRSG